MSGHQCSPDFPAILDPGHTHNVAMSAEHFQDWVQLRLQRIGTVRINQQDVALYAADVQIEGKVLVCPEGIAVYPSGHPRAPRLPILGLRALVRNNVRLLIDGTSVEISC
ncbi:MAG TPA: hypothetical protein VK137_01865 [Planctomycetaceae bacterium]|nr:hypothetical protein [Planctomycetaceae bacterium]